MAPKNPMCSWARLVARVADAVAVAVEDAHEGIDLVADRQPAAGAAVVDDEVRGVAVVRIQGVVGSTVAGPTAAVAVGVEVEISDQLIAVAAGGRAAEAVADRARAVALVAGARQVVAHVVQHGQVVDFDQAVAVGIGGLCQDGEPVDLPVLIAIAGGGGHFEHQGALLCRRCEAGDPEVRGRQGDRRPPTIAASARS